MHWIVAYTFLNVREKKITSFCQVLKKMHTKENWFLFFCLVVYRQLKFISVHQSVKLLINLVKTGLPVNLFDSNWFMNTYVNAESTWFEPKYLPSSVHNSSRCLYMSSTGANGVTTLKSSITTRIRACPRAHNYHAASFTLSLHNCRGSTTVLKVREQNLIREWSERKKFFCTPHIWKSGGYNLFTRRGYEQANNYQYWIHWNLLFSCRVNTYVIGLYYSRPIMNRHGSRICSRGAYIGT